MWISSKDKESLVNANTVFIDGKEVKVLNTNDSNFCIGRYETHLRAIQVLCLIKDNIADYEYAKGTDEAPEYIVFEMPEK